MTQKRQECDVEENYLIIPEISVVIDVDYRYAKIMNLLKIAYHLINLFHYNNHVNKTVKIDRFQSDFLIENLCNYFSLILFFFDLATRYVKLNT